MQEFNQDNNIKIESDALIIHLDFQQWKEDLPGTAHAPPFRHFLKEIGSEAISAAQYSRIV